MPVSLASLPRELMHILACFEPCAVAFSVRADRSLWERFREDARIWVEVVKVARDKGVEVLTKHAASILAVVPTLDRLSPVPLLYVAHGDAVLYSQYQTMARCLLALPTITNGAAFLTPRRCANALCCVSTQ